LIEGPHFSRDQREAWLAVERPDAAVVLRHPRRGDRFRPLGMDESLLVSGFLSAAKVPRAARARVVVAEMGGQIVWVSPGRISESYRVSAVTRYTLHIREEES
jgi:tRNA(Ile)-lysidine synthase